MTADRPEFPLRDFFAGMAEYTFETRLGIADPPLVDYIADLLTRFIRSDSLYPLRDWRAIGWMKSATCWSKPTPAWATPAAKCTATSATSRCSGPASTPRRCARPDRHESQARPLRRLLPRKANGPTTSPAPFPAKGRRRAERSAGAAEPGVRAVRLSA